MFLTTHIPYCGSVFSTGEAANFVQIFAFVTNKTLDWPEIVPFKIEERAADNMK